MLALPINDPNLKTALVADSLCLRQKRIEAAGWAFHDYILKRQNKKSSEAESDSDEDKDRVIPEIDVEKMKSKKRKSSWIDDGKDNFYEILHLPSRYEVTEEIIKKNYKKLALVHHPDKQEEYGEKEKSEWLKVKFKRDLRGLWNADGWNQEKKVWFYSGV